MTHGGVLSVCFQGCPPHQEKARHGAASVTHWRHWEVLGQGTGHTARVPAPALGAAIVALRCPSELPGGISSSAGKPFASHKCIDASRLLFDFLEQRGCERAGSSSTGTSSTGLGPAAFTATVVSAYSPSYKVSSNNLQ